MCRWFAYLSDSEPALLEDVLVRPAHSITKQVHSSYLPKLFHFNASLTKEDKAAQRKYTLAHNQFVNTDGTGIAFYTSTSHEYGQVEGERPQLYKTAQPPTNDPNFMSICSNQASKAIFAHIRMATSIVVPTNSHPFVFGRHSFMHNGVISTFSSSLKLKRRMLDAMTDKAASLILGSTDSEHLAGLYFSFLGDDYEKTYPIEEMRAALEKAVSTVIDLQKKEIEEGGTLVPSSLNLCTTDGTQLLAFRFRNAPEELEQPPSLYYSTKAGPTLSRKYEGNPNRVSPNSEIQPEKHDLSDLQKETIRHWSYATGNRHIAEEGTKPGSEYGKHVIVASEPTTFDQDEWALIEKNKCVLVGTDMRVRVENIRVQF